MDDPDLVSFQRATATHLYEVTMTIYFQIASWIGLIWNGHLQCHCLHGQIIFINSSTLDKQEDLEHLHCWTCMEHEGTCRVRLLHKYWAHCSVVLVLTSPILVHWLPFPCILQVLNSVPFLKWQVSYPTLNKIKLNRATFLQEKKGLKSMAL